MTFPDRPRVVRWQETFSPSEPDLAALLHAEGLAYYPWSNGPNDLYAPHDHAYHKIIYVVRGTITFMLPETGQSLQLHPGDRLELPANTRHSAVVGAEGVTCLEAHLPSIMER